MFCFDSSQWPQTLYKFSTGSLHCHICRMHPVTPFYWYKSFTIWTAAFSTCTHKKGSLRQREKHGGLLGKLHSERETLLPLLNEEFDHWTGKKKKTVVTDKITKWQFNELLFAYKMCVEPRQLVAYIWFVAWKRQNTCKCKAWNRKTLWVTCLLYNEVFGWCGSK